MDFIDSVADDEVVLRHIPGGTNWQGSPNRPRVTGNNFKLRHDRAETGVSVSRFPPTTPDQLVGRIGNVATGSRVARATVAAIRAIEFEVVSVPIPDDPGHAEIRSGTANLDDQDARRQLADLFRFC